MFLALHNVKFHLFSLASAFMFLFSLHIMCTVRTYSSKIVHNTYTFITAASKKIFITYIVRFSKTSFFSWSNFVSEELFISSFLIPIRVGHCKCIFFNIITLFFVCVFYFIFVCVLVAKFIFVQF